MHLYRGSLVVLVVVVAYFFLCFSVCLFFIFLGGSWGGGDAGFHVFNDWGSQLTAEPKMSVVCGTFW